MAYAVDYPIPDEMLTTINACTAGLGVVGAVGGAAGPGADLIIIAPTWVGMMITLAVQAGSSLDQQTAKKLAMAIATAIGSFFAGIKVAAFVGGWLLAMFTGGASVVLAMAGNAALNAKVTNAVGKATARYFLQTTEIETSDVILASVLALVAAELGINLGN